jgi:multidrug transporter EmrE-like cation transporter
MSPTSSVIRRAASFAGAFAATLTMLGATQLWALKAAGLVGVEPSGGDALASLVSTLQSNWEWLIMTGVGLAMMIVVGLVIFGSQRAPEHVFRIAGGIVGILVIIPAVLK